MAGHTLHERQHLHGDVLVRIRIGRGKLSGHGAEIPLRAGYRRAVLKPRQDAQSAVAAIRFLHRPGNEWHPYGVRRGEPDGGLRTHGRRAELRGHHADNFVGRLADHDAASDDIARGAEGLPPEVIADDHGLPARGFVVAPEAAQRRRDTEQRQEVRRYFVEFQLRRLLACLEKSRTIAEHCQAGKALTLAPPVLPVRKRGRRLRARQTRIQIPDDGQFIRVAIRQGLPRDMLEHAE